MIATLFLKCRENVKICWQDCVVQRHSDVTGQSEIERLSHLSQVKEVNPLKDICVNRLHFVIQV